LSDVMTCPYCRGAMQLTPEFYGRSVLCPHCRKELFIPVPQGAPPPLPGPLPHVPNYLVHAVLATFFCCLPFGVVAIVYAAQVDGRLALGDYAGARNLSENAKKWAWAAFVCGFLVIFAAGLLSLMPLLAVPFAVHH
jgi:hypothetical protein